MDLLDNIFRIFNFLHVSNHNNTVKHQSNKGKWILTGNQAFWLLQGLKVRIIVFLQFYGIINIDNNFFFF
jgi:hypothetical protein